ncbi:hypothetical protein P154DRAFT_618290 [Amniculicola lignicola CBS 123094]|uniref:Uncharacterized protein n=1 Tax=Amniculicola lignicola CBS 123094 TaxID=1392246 RepID=A0A6A5WN12_9PLEO|nr:hypothetical protein P154DRAFT_618290 [Amniculicola lignicola CBS 123094]
MRFLNSILTTLCLLIATAIAASVDDIDSTATDVRTLAADNDQPTPQVAGEAAPQRDMVFLYHKREGRSPPAQDNPPLNNKCTRLWGDCYTYVLWGDTRCILYK